MAIIDEYLTAMVEAGASDLHLSVNSPPKLRLSGRLDPIPGYPVIDQTMMFQTLREICRDIPWNKFMDKRDLDFAYEIEGVSRFRVNYFYNFWGQAGVLRVIPSKILTLEELNLPECLKKMADYNQGLVLVTGPTGSGKSSTMAAILDYINANRQKHIITIEDPIEFVHESKRCLINQREVKRDTQSFSDALRSALREDPDIILVGELRDLETIRLALTAAETGHLVFATLHTASAAKTIDRMVDVFPAGEKDMVRSMLSESLQAVLSQVLLRKKGGGRVAAFEIMRGTAAIRNLIREDKVAQMYSTIQTGASQGMVTLDQSLKNLVDQGLVHADVARAKAKSPENF